MSVIEAGLVGILSANRSVMAGDIATNLACLHCGTMCGSQYEGHSTAWSRSGFCCLGCQFVYNLLRDKGLDNFYELQKQNPPVCPLPVQSTNLDYAFCDDPEVVSRMSEDGLKLRFFLEGLNCTACLWLLEKLDRFNPDVAASRLNMGESTIEVQRIPGGSFASIARTLDQLGYRPHPLHHQDSSQKHQSRERRLNLLRIGIAGAAMGNIMIFAVSIYAGAKGDLAREFQLLSGLLALPVVTFCAWPFYKSAYASLRSLRLNLDVPIVAAILAAVLISSWSLLAGHDLIYFDSVSMLVLLLLSSRFILKGVQIKHMQSVRLGDELLMRTVEVQRQSGAREKISSLSLKSQDVLVVAPQMTIPVDGRVLSASANVDTAMLTGESMPRDLGTGAEVEAGFRNSGAEFLVEVKNTPAQTRLAKILRDTEASASQKSDLLRATDQVAQWFIALVFAAALALVIVHWNTNPETGITRALALIIVTCPCVFGMAIPLSMSFAIRSAARRGVVIKNPDAIERLWRVRQVYFDKTGTLTKGEMSVIFKNEIKPGAFSSALALEKNQQHPVARALVKNLTETEIETSMAATEVVTLSSGGIEGKINGELMRIVPIASEQTDSTQNMIRSHYQLEDKTSTVLATFDLADQPKPEASRLLQRLDQRRLIVGMISGDKRPVATATAKALKIDVELVKAEMTPEQKLSFVQHQAATTMMVGDGANDAAALAAAAVGVAVCGSLDLSLKAADVYLTRPQMTSIDDLFSIAQTTRIAIFRNLGFSAGFNLLSGGLAVFGAMSPLWAAVLMPLSSMTVVLSAIWTGNKLINQGELK